MTSSQSVGTDSLRFPKGGSHGSSRVHSRHAAVTTVLSKPADTNPGTAYPLRRTPTQDRASRQVERILDAACAEVVERGYDAASTSGIAKRAEIAVGSVYRY